MRSKAAWYQEVAVHVVVREQEAVEMPTQADLDLLSTPNPATRLMFSALSAWALTAKKITALFQPAARDILTSIPLSLPLPMVHLVPTWLSVKIVAKFML